ncbi:MAG: 2Fe-2S iron-sulfur cluster-binding protein [Gemmatimonadota bacterium]
MPSYDLTVNGESRTIDATAETPLLWVLRDDLGLTGTKYGCGRGYCGAWTIEGLDGAGRHPVQRAWIEERVSQCGYCQAGQIMRAASLLDRNPSPSDAEIGSDMHANLCRCGTYLRIRRAIRRAAELARAGT